MGVIDTVCKARGEFDAVFRATSNLIHNTFMHMIELWGTSHVYEVMYTFCSMYSMSSGAMSQVSPWMPM